MKLFSILLPLLFCFNCTSSSNQIHSSEDGYSVITIKLLNSNVYLIQQKGHYLMIDSGDPNELDKLNTHLTRLKVNPENIDAIILTHGHVDHAGNAHYFQQKYKTPIIAGTGDLVLFRTGKNDALCPVNLGGKIAKKHLQKKHFTPFTPTQSVKDTASTSLFSNINATIIPLSGHTHGSLIITFQDIAFVGDLIRGGIILKKQPRTHFYNCDLHDNQLDIMNLAKTQQHIKTWYTGHFGPLEREKVFKKYKTKKL